jgi:hypothetical protein
MRKLALALALIAPLAACDREEAANPEAETPENVMLHDTLPAAAEAAADTTGAITVALREWNVRPARDTLRDVGETTVFRVRNLGAYPHALEVEGQGEEWVTDTIEPGEWVLLETRLEPGTYELYCPIDDEHGDHSERGMAAYLVVD